MTHRPLKSLALCALVAATAAVPDARQYTYPKARKVEQVDTYSGVTVADPYRWLEDDNSSETAAWVEAENKVTFDYLERIPFRKALTERVIALNNYERNSAPSRKGAYVFFTRNAGLQNQSVLYVQRGMDGQPEVLIDPNTWSEDGTVRLGTFAPSRDAKYAVYGISKSGSDWQEFRVMELATRKTLDDSLEWVKVSSVGWFGDGFFYSRYPKPETGKEKASINEGHQVYFHKVGTPQSQDTLVFEDKANPQRFHTVDTTEDERFAVLNISDRGKGKDGNAVYVRDLQKGETTFTPAIPDITDDTFEVIDNVGDRLLIATNHKAANQQVILVDPKRPAEADWTIVLPEQKAPLQSASSAGGKLFATYLEDVTTKAYVYSLDGKLENTVALPGPGIAGGFNGNRDDTAVFYSFNSLNTPPTIYRYDIATKQSATFRQPKVPGYDPTQFETKQVFYHEQGRHAGADVPRLQEGAEARWHEPDAALRVRRVQHRRSHRRSAPRGSRSWNRASSTRTRTCAAAASTARSGIRRE